MNSPSLTPSGARRQPKQQRSRMLVASIREACLKILQSGHAEELTARRIAEVAGVTIASFYQYYSNKEAVMVDVLLERGPGEAERVVAEAKLVQELSAESLPKTIEALVNLTCDRHARLLSQHGEIYRRYHRYIDFPTLIRASLNRPTALISWDEWVRKLLTQHSSVIDVPSIDMAAFLIATAIVEMTGKAVDTSPKLLEEDLFRKSLISLLLRYLHC